jgi:dihydroorotase (multifunctional complex type)
MAIQTAITYAQYTKAKIHIHHVTSFDGSQLIAEAKRKGINITTETCPHYLLLDANKTVQKVYPPIRDEWHRKCLWDALARGTIDMLATDHAPHTFEEKARPLWEAPAGLSGVETFVPLMLNEVNKGTLTLNEFARYASEMPAKVWNIFPRKGSIQSGADADFTIVDMGIKKTIKKNELHSKSKTSPYDKMEIQGIPVSTIIRGKFVMKDCKLTGDRGFGELISPAL